ncbi:MAG: 50S ribosomal protein L18, partial [Nanoarchaeota archaeon]|nr:50S ribosomal protein L18 [Nanoarchaeota archaeon]MCG2720257.1 50S ribosomal protein L18 [Nanoarchaeota archaeon]
KSLKNITVQIIDYKDKGDLVMVNATSKELIKLGWKGYGRNVTSAYLVGLLCGVKAKEKGIKQAVLDSGLYISTKGSIIYAALKGALDSGLNVPHGEELFPTEERIKGTHLKKGADSFEKVKASILGGKK